MTTTSRKRRIFIGSSSETKDLAVKIKERLDPKYDCVIWGEDFFNRGGYVFVDLIKKAIGFDHAILIGGADDKVIRLSQNTEKLSPRDNIYLEYGMYSGILSTDRILFLLHEDCRVASDLTGMTLTTYKDADTAIDVCDRWLGSSASGRIFGGGAAKNIELLPTVGVAVGYFHNFLKPALDMLSSTHCFSFEGKEFPIREKRLTVAVPDYLEGDDTAVIEYTRVLIDKFQLADAMLGRYRVLIDPKGLEAGVLDLYDMPSTLLTVLKTVDYIFGVTAGLGPQDAQFAKYRAFDNFNETLEEMLAGKPRFSSLVEFKRFNFSDN
jgi:hypothetical protein